MSNLLLNPIMDSSALNVIFFSILELLFDFYTFQYSSKNLQSHVLSSSQS